MPNNEQNKSLKGKMTANTRVSLHMCVLLSIDVIDGWESLRREIFSGFFSIYWPHITWFELNREHIPLNLEAT